jgi:hypothetical protein
MNVGLCLCGCGQATRIAPVTDRSKGWIKGQPLKYMMGHRLKAGASMEKSPRWKGGRYLSTHGYVLLSTPDGRQYEHILVAEKAIGRALLYISPGHPDNEVVHHINGDKQNNGPNNLLVCTHRYHLELHHRLEDSPEWPEFTKVVRNTKEKAREHYHNSSQ